MRALGGRRPAHKARPLLVAGGVGEDAGTPFPGLMSTPVERKFMKNRCLPAMLFIPSAHHLFGSTRNFRPITCMKTLAKWVLPFLLMSRTALMAADAPRKFDVYMERVPPVAVDLEKARRVSSQIFAAISVELRWVDWREQTSARSTAIVVQVTVDTPPNSSPGLWRWRYRLKGRISMSFTTASEVWWV